MLPSEVREIEDLPPVDGINDRKPATATTNPQGAPNGNAA